MNNDLFSASLFGGPPADFEDTEEEDDVNQDQGARSGGGSSNSDSSTAGAWRRDHDNQQDNDTDLNFPHPIIRNLSEAIEYLSHSTKNIKVQKSPTRSTCTSSIGTESTICISRYSRIYKSNLVHFQSVISTYLGSMAQCRVHGKEMDRLGGIQHLMHILHTLIHNGTFTFALDKSECANTNHQDTSELELEESEELLDLEMDLTNVTLGALRDLACGHASNRLQIGQYSIVHETESESEPVSSSADDDGIGKSLALGETIPARVQTAKDMETGIDIVSYFIKIYRNQSWDQIPTLQLRCVTNALGVMRNITHSTPSNCQALHQANMTTHLIERLRGMDRDDDDDDDDDGCGVCGSHSSLPDASRPWREACYRIAGTLINMAEKCQDAAKDCARDEILVMILIESWGGVSFQEHVQSHAKERGGEHGNGSKTGSESKVGEKKKKKKKAIPVLHLGLKAVLLEKLSLEEKTKGDGKEISVRDGESSDVHDVCDELSHLNINLDHGSPRQGPLIIAQKQRQRRTMELLDVIHSIMEREDRRKRAAQEREVIRKKMKEKKSSVA